MEGIRLGLEIPNLIFFSKVGFWFEPFVGEGFRCFDLHVSKDWRGEENFERIPKEKMDPVPGQGTPLQCGRGTPYVWPRVHLLAFL